MLLPEAKNLDSDVCIFGHSKFTVKIHDKSLRAYDCSHEATEALAYALRNDQRKFFKDCPTRTYSVVYAFWVMCFKGQTRAPSLCGAIIATFLFAVFLSLDLALTTAMILHIFTPGDLKTTTYGLTFFGILPVIALVGPIWALIAVMKGDVVMLKIYSSINICLVLFNYPLTFAYMIYLDDQWYWIYIILGLLFNKIPLSSMNARIRAYFQYPLLQQNLKKFDDLCFTIKGRRVINV